MLLRRAVPNSPDGGITNAAVLNHSLTDGLGKPTGSPATTSARSVPLVPRLTSEKSPRILGVNGSPEAIVQSPLQFQSPTTARSGLFAVSHRRSWPKGSSHR